LAISEAAVRRAAAVFSTLTQISSTLALLGQPLLHHPCYGRPLISE
jgi:hypothetical protein